MKKNSQKKLLSTFSFKKIFTRNFFCVIISAGRLMCKKIYKKIFLQNVRTIFCERTSALKN